MRTRTLPLNQAPINVRMPGDAMPAIDAVVEALNHLTPSKKHTRSDAIRVCVVWAAPILLDAINAMTRDGATEVTVGELVVATPSLLNQGGSAPRGRVKATKGRAVRLHIPSAMVRKLRTLCDALRARTGAEEPHDYIAEMIGAVLERSVDALIDAARA